MSVVEAEVGDLVTINTDVLDTAKKWYINCGRVVPHNVFLDYDKCNCVGLVIAKKVDKPPDNLKSLLQTMRNRAPSLCIIFWSDGTIHYTNVKRLKRIVYKKSSQKSV